MSLVHKMKMILYGLFINHLGRLLKQTYVDRIIYLMFLPPSMIISVPVVHSLASLNK